MERTEETDYNIVVKEKVDVSENLLNWKLWFNGLKKFSAVKVEPPQPPETLEIHVSDVVDTKDLFGGN